MSYPVNPLDQNGEDKYAYVQAKLLMLPMTNFEMQQRKETCVYGEANAVVSSSLISHLSCQLFFVIICGCSPYSVH